MYKIPTLIFDKTIPAWTGTTAHAAIDKPNVMIGAIRKTVLSDPSGSMISLNMNFKPSAGTWNSP